jgi:hypothetical protein
MNKFVGALALGSTTLIAACVDAPAPEQVVTPQPPDLEPGGSTLDIRRDAGEVIGSDFVCTGTWPHYYTPCDYPWSTQAITLAKAFDGLLRLTLRRDFVPNDYEPYPIEGGGSAVFIYLLFDAPDGALIAFARETTVTPDSGVEEISDPIAGWINPIALSPWSDRRNAGKFSLTFSWGAIHGTYDTGPPTL